MYVYNITFVTAPSARERFLEWMRGEAIPALTNSGYAAKGARLHCVVEAGGEKPGPEHGLSMALHVEFPGESEAHEWHDNVLPAVLGDFNRRFGPQAAFFITLLETLSL